MSSEPKNRECVHTERTDRSGETARPLPDEDNGSHHTLVQQLRVHQIELEMQNAELQDAQQHLEFTRGKYMDLFNTAPVGFIILDRSGFIKEANRTFSDMLKADGGDVVNQPFGAFLSPASRQLFLGQFRSFFNAPDDRQLDLELRSGGTSTIIVRLFGKKERFGEQASPDGLLRVAVVDITRQKQAETMLKETIAELRIANQKIQEQQAAIISQERVKLLFQIAGATAHELRQPLMIMLGNIELLENDFADVDKQSRYMENIKQAAQRIAGTITKIQNLKDDSTKSYARGEQIIDFDQPVKVLLVDGSEHYLSRLRAEPELVRHSWRVAREGSAAAAIERLQTERFDIVLVDHRLPDGGAVSFLDALALQRLRIPVIVLAECDDVQLIAEVVQKGAVDLLNKSKAEGAYLYQFVSGHLKTARHVHEVQETVQSLVAMTTRDSLTGLCNRRCFHEILEREMDRCRRCEETFSLCMVDFNGKPLMNGQAQQEWRKEFGAIAGKCLRSYDVACYYEKNRFCILLPYLDQHQSKTVLDRLQELVRRSAVFQSCFSGEPAVEVSRTEFHPSHHHTVSDLIGSMQFERPSGIPAAGCPDNPPQGSARNENRAGRRMEGQD